MIVLFSGEATEAFVTDLTKRFSEAPVGTLLSESVRKSLHESHRILTEAGAEALCGTGPSNGAGCCVANTLLRVSGAAQRFIDGKWQ
jgi:hypothetical protein